MRIFFSLAKEITYYEKEAEREQARHDKMKGEGADDYQLKKQVILSFNRSVRHLHIVLYELHHEKRAFDQLRRVELSLISAISMYR